MDRPVGRLSFNNPTQRPKGRLTFGQPKEKQGPVNKEPAFPFSPQDFFVGVAEREGSGDTVTDVPTAHFGVTQSASDAVGEPFSENMSEEMARLVGTKYVSKLERDFSSRISGWEDLPLELREGAVDAAYNMGPKVFTYPKFMAALSSGNGQEAAMQLLNTAKTEGKSSKGLAKRRAEVYNIMLGEGSIDKVEQLEDGTLIYSKGGKEVFSYKVKGGRHRTSAVGSIAVGTPK